MLNFTINVQTKPGVSSVIGFGVMRVVFNATAGGGQVYYSCADVSLVITENFSLAVGYLTLVLLCLSITGALITIITFTIFKSLRTFAIKLIMYLCVCIICGQTTFLAVSILSTQADRNETLYGNHFCVVAGAMIHYFFLTNFFWCLCIAINLYLMVRVIIVSTHPGPTDSCADCQALPGDCQSRKVLPPDWLGRAVSDRTNFSSGRQPIRRRICRWQLLPAREQCNCLRLLRARCRCVLRQLGALRICGT